MNSEIPASNSVPPSEADAPDTIMPPPGDIPEEEIAFAVDEAANVAALREERDKLKDQLLRTAADFDNFRKRTRRDLEDAARRAKEDAIKEILPLVDNLHRAAEASESATDVEAVAEGVHMVLRSFDEIGARLGLNPVEALGKPFDPNEHDAVQQIESDEHPPGTVMAEVLKGYKLGDKLVRAAMVVVAKPPAAPADD